MQNEKNWIYMALEELIDWDPSEGEKTNDTTNDDQTGDGSSESSPQHT